MNFGILAAGAAQGLGEGLKDLGKQWREDDIRAENNRMEMEKEKRIEDATIRAETRKQGYEKEAEQRAIANKATIAQQDIDIANKPENVQAKANAEKTLAQAKIDVELDPNNTAKKLALKQAELDMQTASQIKVHQATDTTDYAGRDIQHKLNNLEIHTKEAELKGMPKDAKSAVTAYLDQAKALQTQAAGYDIGSAERIDLNTQIREAHDSANAILQRYGYGAEKKDNKDLLELNQKVVEPAPNKKESAPTVEQTKTSGIFPKPKTKVTGENSPLLSGKLKDQYEALSPELKGKVDEILNIENADSNRKLQLIQGVINKSK